MTTLQVLEQARDLIREPENWVQRDLGNVLRGGPYCMAGAIKAVLQVARGGAAGPWVGYFDTLEHGAGQALIGLLPLKSIPEFNDTHTHAEVLELFNLAIAAEIKKTQENKPKVGQSVDEPTTLGEPVLSGAC